MDKKKKKKRKRRRKRKRSYHKNIILSFGSQTKTKLLPIFILWDLFHKSHICQINMVSGKKLMW